jgi:hypothetical protein
MSTAPPTSNPPGALLLTEVSHLLTHKYTPLETGYARLTNGMHFVAAHTYMPHVTAAMIDWWFGYIHTTDQYQLWHPRDHVFSDWEGPRNNDSTYVGGAHLVHEYIGGVLAKLKIQFKSPKEYFGEGYEEAFKEAGVGTAVCGRVAVWIPEQNFSIDTGHLVHLVEDTEDGCRMRSRFWLGDVEGWGVEERMGAELPFPAEGLCKHACEEMAILGGILPELYKKHGSKAKI